MKIIDTHAHLFTEEFEEDIDQVIERAKNQHIDKILMPNIDVESIDAMLDLERKHLGYLYSMIGLHPCSVNADYQSQLEVIKNRAGRENIVAIGEIGTDLYWDKTYWEQQKDAFRIQSQFAIDMNLPVVIHCRESINETIDLVKEFDGKLTGVFHCFTGNVEQAKQITDLGFYLGFGGVATFKNGGLDKVLPFVAKNRIVLETDSPYLSPAPERGKRNEPHKINYVLQKVADVLETSKEELADLTTENANRLFFNP